MSEPVFLPPNIRNSLPVIREAADAACDSAQEAGVKGAINWADLGVVEVRFCVDEDGSATYDVLIEEAAPGSVELMRYIGSFLERLDLVYPVEVRTEW